MTEQKLSLFQATKLRQVVFKNRLAASPMCQYSANQGAPTDWHLVHLGRFAIGGFGLIVTEATAIEPEGRISHGDLGLWSDDFIEPLRRITDFIRSQGAVSAVQLGHAGRRASSQRPWHGHGPLGEREARSDEPAWPVVAPSAIPHGQEWPVPRALSIEDMRGLRQKWVDAAQRADAAGFDMIELHGAHGYLLHTFLSPLSNRRNDAYGGDLAGRMRFPLEVVESVRAAWPASKPLAIRISAVDSDQGGLTIEDSIVFACELKSRGVDLIDCSSGGIGGSNVLASMPRPFGFQIPLSARIREGAGIATMTVGLITDPVLANDAVPSGSADFIALGRQALFDPNWPLHARRSLTGNPDYGTWPEQVGWWLERREGALAAASQQPPVKLGLAD